MKQEENARKVQVGIVLVTHVDYGAALLRAAESILGPAQDCTTIQVDISNDVEETIARLSEAVSRLDSGLGVLLVTDMFGGTPTNLSLSLLGKANVEVLTGVNLPMLLKIMANRDKMLSDLAEIACVAGREGIAVAGDILRNKARKNG